MNDFIQLTDAFSKKKMYINYKGIYALYIVIDGRATPYTEVALSGGTELGVKETPDEILKLIHDIEFKVKMDGNL